MREDNRVYFSSNRIVEICYGLNGLIDFLDLLFTQIPTKRQVKSKFNYYFTIKKQIAAIEQQVLTELSKQYLTDVQDGRKQQFESLVPKRSVDEDSKIDNLLERKSSVSIVF